MEGVSTCDEVHVIEGGEEDWLLSYLSDPMEVLMAGLTPCKSGEERIEEASLDEDNVGEGEDGEIKETYKGSCGAVLIIDEGTEEERGGRRRVEGDFSGGGQLWKEGESLFRPLKEGEISGVGINEEADLVENSNNTLIISSPPKNNNLLSYPKIFSLQKIAL